MSWHNQPERVAFKSCCWNVSGHGFRELPYSRSPFLEYSSIKRQPSQHHSWHPISSLSILEAFFRCQASLTSHFPSTCHSFNVLLPLQGGTRTVTPLASCPSCQLCSRASLWYLPIPDAVRELAGPKEIALVFLCSGCLFLYFKVNCRLTMNLP